MPFAGYADFNECIIDQINKGHTQEEAQRICGYLQAKAEKKKSVAESSIGTLDASDLDNDTK